MPVSTRRRRQADHGERAESNDIPDVTSDSSKEVPVGAKVVAGGEQEGRIRSEEGGREKVVQHRFVDNGRLRHGERA